MPELGQFVLFLTAAIILAITPGPGIFYVLARSVKGGRSEGIASSVGTGLGGLGHVIAAGLGLSAVLASSGFAFSVVKYAGAAYLVYLGIRTLTSPSVEPSRSDIALSGYRKACYQGILTEVLNPKTALFFLAFIPQFVDPLGNVFAQFLLLGSISVALNTSADLIVASLAGPISVRLQQSVKLRRRQRRFTGGALMTLGAFVAVSGESA